jgi:hypothetical protein
MNIFQIAYLATSTGNFPLNELCDKLSNSDNEERHQDNFVKHRIVVNFDSYQYLEVCDGNILQLFPKSEMTTFQPLRVTTFQLLSRMTTVPYACSTIPAARD